MSQEDAGCTDAMEVWSTNAFQAVLKPLAPEFERASGHVLSVKYRSSNMIMAHAAKGQRGDAVVATRPALDELAAQGKLEAASITDLASTGLGIGIRAGADKPDIGSPEALRRTLLAARSIVYSSTGASGLYFSRLIEHLGIVSQVKAKAIVYTGGLIGDVIVRGEAELGAQMVSEILAVPGVELAGELPTEFQYPTMFSAGMFTGTPHPAAVRALAAFLTTPQAQAMYEKAGMRGAALR